MTSIAIVSSCSTQTTESGPYPRLMIMVRVVAVRPQSIFLVVRRVARYALVGVYNLNFRTGVFLLYGRARLCGACRHS